MPARTRILAAAAVAAVSLPGCGGSTRAPAHPSPTAAKRPPSTSSTTVARRLRIPGRLAGELARATVTPKGQADVIRRFAGAGRYAVRVACSAGGPDVKAAYTVYKTTARSSRKLTSGGFPCDGNVYVNSVGRLHAGVQVSFTRLPRRVVDGYAIVVPE
jgi:hypothetical protein